MSGLVGQVGARSGIVGSTTDSTQLDYEEGFWSPTFGSTTSPNEGKYVKIGDMVFIHGDITNADAGNHYTIGGLPFATGNKHSVWYTGWSTGGIVGGYFNNNNTTMDSMNSGANTVNYWNSGIRALMAGTYTTF